MTSKYQIYCDMDGVLTDFESRFEHFTGMQPKEYSNKYGDPRFWDLIDREIGIEYWTGMEWMETGPQLWEYIQPYNPIILTSPSKHNGSRLGKKMWVREHIVPAPKVIFSYAKEEHSTRGRILIDDKPKHIRNWRKKGGIAIHCKDNNIHEVLTELKLLGL